MMRTGSSRSSLVCSSRSFGKFSRNPSSYCPQAVVVRVYFQKDSLWSRGPKRVAHDNGIWDLLKFFSSWFFLVSCVWIFMAVINDVTMSNVEWSLKIKQHADLFFLLLLLQKDFFIDLFLFFSPYAQNWAERIPGCPCSLWWRWCPPCSAPSPW